MAIQITDKSIELIRKVNTYSILALLDKIKEDVEANYLTEAHDLSKDLEAALTGLLLLKQMEEVPVDEDYLEKTLKHIENDKEIG